MHGVAEGPMNPCRKTAREIWTVISSILIYTKWMPFVQLLILAVVTRSIETSQEKLVKMPPILKLNCHVQKLIF